MWARDYIILCEFVSCGVLLDCANVVTLLTVRMFVLTRLKEVVPGRVVKKTLSFIKNYLAFWHVHE